MRRDSDLVVWNDFRDGPRGPRIEGLSEVRFNASQYLDELDRSDRERGWESPDRTAARLMREAVLQSDKPLGVEGWKFEWSHAGTSERVATGPQGRPGRETPSFALRAVPGLEVALTNRGRQLVLGFSGATQDPVRRAEEIVELLWHGDPYQWPVKFKGGDLAAWPDAERNELGTFRAGRFRG